jgi:hypothetical protein
MKPPIPAGMRDTSALDVLDAEMLAGPSAHAAVLPEPVSTLALSVQSRRSVRRSGRVTLQRALDVLAPLMTATVEWTAADQYVERQTFVPSAGARHALTALVLSKDAEDTQHRAWAISPSVKPRCFAVSRYGAEISSVLQATSAALRLADAPDTVIVVLARPRRILSKYPDGHSLLWRDAGAYLASAHLVAAGLGLHSCIVGIAETTRFELDGTTEALIDVGALTLAEKVGDPCP